MNFSSPRFRGIVAAALALIGAVVAPQPTSAQSYTWLANTTGTIYVATNWVGGTAGFSTGTATNWAGTTALITGGTAILAGSSNFYSGTMTVGATGVITTGATGTLSLKPLGISNFGTIRHADSGALNINQTGTAMTNAGVIESTGGGTLRFYTNSTVINNTGGLIRATNGSINFFQSTFTLNGGTMSVATGGTLFSDITNTAVTMNNVVLTNAGTMTMNKAFGVGTRVFTYALQGTGTFDNSGIVNLTFGTLSGSTTTANNTMSMTLSSGQTVLNTGTINVSQLYAQTLTTGSQPVFISGASNFTNQGRINITTSTSSVDTAQLRWSTALGNAGIMSVDGPKSSIQLGSQTFTQTGATSQLALTGGGRIVAGSVVINSGTLLGTGTVSAPATISGVVAPGDTGIGMLSIGGNVTWNAGNAWGFELGNAAPSLAAASTGSSTQDLLSITGNFIKGTGSGFTFDFLQTGTTGWYRLADWSASTTFAAGDFAATNLASGNTANFVVDGATSALYVEIVAAVPEPGSLTLAGIGVAAGGWLSRRFRVRRRAA